MFGSSNVSSTSLAVSFFLLYDVAVVTLSVVKEEICFFYCVGRGI